MARDTTAVDSQKPLLARAIPIVTRMTDPHSSTQPEIPADTPKSRDQTEDALVDGPRKKLTLLDLPVDILQTVFQKFTNTNDLTSLARCHSALHAQVTPLIYNKFDIVWPEAASSATSHAGVDALTHGLSTLVMAEDVFGEAPWQRTQPQTPGPPKPLSDVAIRKRRGNHYARYVRKFSLGNGPRDWVQEYLLTKEGGKMLATLVALALARMKSLETFIWDMPTGVGREVWASLSYLGDLGDRLDSVSIRWHDNSDQRHLTTSSTGDDAQNPGTLLTHTCLGSVEQPSFSILPALKSLSVVQIDELQYLDEMSVLIHRSLHKLRHLKIGIAEHAMLEDWAKPWHGRSYRQIDHNEPAKSITKIPDRRLGGVLGVLTSGFFDIRQETSRVLKLLPNTKKAPPAHSLATQPPSNTPATPAPEPMGESAMSFEITDNDDTSATADDPVVPVVPDEPLHPFDDAQCVADPKDLDIGLILSQDPEAPRLALESLTMERCMLHLPTLAQAIDWTRLTSLTLIHCLRNQHDLWNILTSRLDKLGRGSVALEHIHTDHVTPSLLSFVNNLPPNTLKSLFLQAVLPSRVSLTDIFRRAVKRHRLSLSKLLIDSMDRPIHRQHTARWRAWAFTREVLDYILNSSKMPALRELGCSIDYRHDWHYFLTRLPNATRLQSVHVVRVGDHLTYKAQIRELSLQVLDMVTLRPEVELRFVGLMSKCYEIYKGDIDPSEHGGARGYMSGTGAPVAVENDGDEDEDEEDEGMDEDEDDGGDDDGDGDGDGHSEASSDLPDDVVRHMLDAVLEDHPLGAAGGELDADHVLHHHDMDHQHHRPDDVGDRSAYLDAYGAQNPSQTDDGSVAGSSEAGADLRIREIFFYDEQVAVFKARHGKL